jgi:hypothetical protein
MDGDDLEVNDFPHPLPTLIFKLGLIDLINMQIILVDLIKIQIFIKISPSATKFMVTLSEPNLGLVNVNKIT